MTNSKTIQFSIDDFTTPNHSITKDEIFEKKKKEVNNLIKEYLEDCKARLSSHTVRSHETGLKAFQTFLGKTPIVNATKYDVRKFLNELKKRGRAKATISIRLWTIHSFFKYLNTYQNIIVPSLEDVDINDYPRSTWEGKGQDALTRSDVRALLEAPDNLRDILIIAILYYLGLRASEVALLKVENVDLENRVIEIVGKGNKPRKVPYSSKLDRVIHLWLHRERRSYVSSDSPYFFPSKHGKHLCTKAIHEIVHKAAEKAGIQKVIGKRADGKKMFKVHPHILRHSYATHAVDDDIPLNIVQKMMGHSNISTTIRYAGEHSVFKTYHERFKGV